MRANVWILVVACGLVMAVVTKWLWHDPDAIAIGASGCMLTVIIGGLSAVGLTAARIWWLLIRNEKVS